MAKTKKDLAVYLADYLEHEINELPDDWDGNATEIIEQGLEAFESTENVEIDIQVINNDLCCKCRKCGKTICGNDMENYTCFEEL